MGSTNHRHLSLNYLLIFISLITHFSFLVVLLHTTVISSTSSCPLSSFFPSQNDCLFNGEFMRTPSTPISPVRSLPPFSYSFSFSVVCVACQRPISLPEKFTRFHMSIYVALHDIVYIHILIFYFYYLFFFWLIFQAGTFDLVLPSHLLFYFYFCKKKNSLILVSCLCLNEGVGTSVGCYCIVV